MTAISRPIRKIDASRVLAFLDAEGVGIAVDPDNRLPVETNGIGYVSSSSNTRPADTTPYPALSVVSSNPASYEQFDSIGPAAGGKVLLTLLKLRWDSSALPAGMGYFRLHLYNAAPTPIADNAAFNLIAADRDKYMGFIELPPPLDLGDTLYTETEAMNYAIRKEVTVLSGGTIYGILQTVNAFTPASAITRELTLIGVGV